MKTIISFFILIIPLLSLSQNFKIDWQTCYGGPTNDQAYDIVKVEDGYLLTGLTKREGYNDLLLIKLDTSGSILWEKQYGGSLGDGAYRILPTLDNNFFLVGASASSDGDITNDPYPDGGLDYWVLKIDPEGNIIWDKIYGGNGIDNIWDGAVTADGGLIALGWTDSNDGDITNSFGWLDVWMIKLNSEGEKQWDYTMGTASYDFSGGIIQTSDKGYLITSSSEENTGGNIDCDAFNEKTEVVIFKLDSLSNFQWQQCYGGSNSDTPVDMIETEDGYLLTCITRTGDGDIAGGGYHPGSSGPVSSADIWIIKIDFNGNLLWQKCYGGSGDEYPKRIMKTDDNNFLVFGNAGSHDGDVVGNHSSGNPYLDIWVFKINGNGDLLWQQCFGGNGSEELEAGIVKVSDSKFIIATTIYGYNSGQITCQETFSSDQIWVISVTDSTTIGLNDNPKPNDLIKIYPNPCTDYIVFERSDKKSCDIQITDLYGHIIDNFTFSERKIWNTKGNKAGLYFYSISDAEGCYKGKFIISQRM
jgi:hypothetical protein